MTEEHNAAGLLWRTAATHAGRPAIVERATTTTYETLRRRAAAMAGRLAQAGVGSGDRVAILLERGADAAAAFFGVTAAGGVAVNLNEGLRPRQIDHILADSGSVVLLTSEDLLARLPRAPITTARILLAEATERGSEDWTPTAAGRDDLAQITYTSGSTGLPKGVMLSHGNLRAVTAVVTGYLELRPDDRIASLLPFSFVYGFNQLLCAVGSGASLLVERSPLPQEIATTLVRSRVTILAAVPPLWAQLLAAPAFRRPLPALRVMTNAGGRLPVESVRALRVAQPHARLFLMYGLTEAMRSTYLAPEEADRRPDSIGRPIPGAAIEVLRDDGTPCEPGEVGELVHRGSTVGLGYWNDPEATAAVFRPNVGVFSGDLVRRDAEGYFYFVGRKDRMIKTLGHRVSPDEVADVLVASGEVAEAAVTAEADPQRGQRIVAHVVLAATGTLDCLQAYCELELPRHMQPTRWATYDALPRTPGGKYDLSALGEGAAAT